MTRHRTHFQTLVFSAALAITLLPLAGSLSGCSKEKAGLVISGLEPKVIPTEGGQVIIEGSGFQSDGTVSASIYFGDRQGKVISIDGDTKMIVRAPGGAPGAEVDVRLVFDDAREFALKNACKYADINEGVNVDALTKKGDKKAEEKKAEEKAPEEEKPEEEKE